MAYKQRWLEYFDVLDGDNSGFVDAGDLVYLTRIAAKSLGQPEDSPGAKQIGEGVSSFFKELIRTFDANKDGKVSREEMLSGVDKFFVGKTANDLPGWWQTNVDQFFTVVDHDHDGQITLEEYKTFLRRIDQESTDEEVSVAYNWALKQSASGKFDPATFAKIIFIWATSPDPAPEASRLLFYLTKVAKKHTQ